MKRWVWVVLSVLLLGLLGFVALMWWVNPLGLFSTGGREFGHYFQNPSRQVRNLKTTGSTWIDTHLVMTFELDEPLLYKPIPAFKHLEGPALKRYFTENECGTEILPSSLVKLDYQPNSTKYGNLPGSDGRLIVQNGNQYCVFIWEF